MGLAIKGAVEEGASEYDLLQGPEPYKALWARLERPIGRIELTPDRLRGAVYRRTLEWSRSARHAARRMLPKAIADRIAYRRSMGGGR